MECKFKKGFAILVEAIKDSTKDKKLEEYNEIVEKSSHLFKNLLAGYNNDISKSFFAKSLHLNKKSDDIVLCENLQFTSLCKHHLVPFNGSCYLAYQPDKYIMSYGKIGYLVRSLALRLNLQESLTNNICELFYNITKSKGVAVYIKAQHNCFFIKDIARDNSYLTTLSFLGSMKTEKFKQEFLRLIK